MVKFDQILMQMLAASRQGNLSSLAASTLAAGVERPIDRQTLKVLREEVGISVAEMMAAMMRTAYFDLQNGRPDWLFDQTTELQRVDYLVAEYKRRNGPFGDGHPIPIDASVTNPLPQGNPQLTVSEAREQNLWCDWHDMPYERRDVKGERLYCRQCVTFMYASLTTVQWKALVSSFLEVLSSKTLELFKRAPKSFSEEDQVHYWSEELCIQALNRNTTPHQFVWALNRDMKRSR